MKHICTHYDSNVIKIYVRFSDYAKFDMIYRLSFLPPSFSNHGPPRVPSENEVGVVRK